MMWNKYVIMCVYVIHLSFCKGYTSDYDETEFKDGDLMLGAHKIELQKTEKLKAVSTMETSKSITHRSTTGTLKAGNPTTCNNSMVSYLYMYTCVKTTKSQEAHCLHKTF